MVRCRFNAHHRWGKGLEKSFSILFAYILFMSIKIFSKIYSKFAF